MFVYFSTFDWISHETTANSKYYIARSVENKRKLELNSNKNKK